MPAPRNTQNTEVPENVQKMIAERDALASKYDTVAEDHPGETESQHRGHRAQVSRRVAIKDAEITDALVTLGLDVLVASGFTPWKSPVKTNTKVTPASITDADLIATLDEWTTKIASLPAGFEGVAHTMERDHVQPLLRIAKDRDSLTVDGKRVALAQSAE